MGWKTEIPEGFGVNVQVPQQPAGAPLKARFSWPPFSILDTRAQAWQRRKRQWLGLGIKSEIGRGDSTYVYAIGDKTKWEATKDGNTGMPDTTAGVSVFDPVLCELIYQWFCPPNGQIIDPFAGGSVRGIVACYTGYKYWGCELRPEQVEANKAQGQTIIPDNLPEWVCGDSWHEARHAPTADFIFSCPPYGNLETYSDLPGDISNMEYAEFLLRYTRIIRRTCQKLRDNRFACFVVSNYRNNNGIYHNLVGDTVQAFERAGLGLYNEGVLINAIGSLPVRVPRAFQDNRKFGRVHQQVLVFYKGQSPNQNIRKDFPKL